jgi:hypothetical protein
LQVEELESRIVPAGQAAGIAAAAGAVAGLAAPDSKMTHIAKFGIDLAGLAVDASPLFAWAGGPEAEATAAGAVAVKHAKENVQIGIAAASFVNDLKKPDTLGAVGDGFTLIGLALKESALAIPLDLLALAGDVLTISNDWFPPTYHSPSIPQPTPQPAPTPTPIPKGPAAAIAGTYSGTLKPSDANDLPLPKDSKTTSRQIKLTINPDGSGSLSVAPFEDQTVFTLAFTAKVTQEADGTIVLGADVQQGNGSFTFDLIGAEVANGNQLVARNLALTDNNRGLEVSFDNISLNRN